MSEMLTMMERAEAEYKESANSATVAEGLNRVLCGLAPRKEKESRRPAQHRLIILRADGRTEIYPSFV